MGTRQEWVIDFLRAGNFPTTPENIAACLAWCRSEFGGSTPAPAAFNLFATTMGEPGSTAYNGAGVQNFADWWSGVKANRDTLQLNEPGYQSIRDHLTAGHDASATCAAVAASAWGSHPTDAMLAEVYNDPAHNADLVVGDRPGDPAPAPTPTPTATEGDPMILYSTTDGDATTYYRDAGGVLVALAPEEAAAYYPGVTEGWVRVVALGSMLSAVAFNAHTVAANKAVQAATATPPA